MLRFEGLESRYSCGVQEAIFDPPVGYYSPEMKSVTSEGMATLKKGRKSLLSGSPEIQDKAISTQAGVRPG